MTRVFDDEPRSPFDVEAWSDYVRALDGEMRDDPSEALASQLAYARNALVFAEANAGRFKQAA